MNAKMVLNQNSYGEIWLQVEGCFKAKMGDYRQALPDATEIQKRFNEHAALVAVAEAGKNLLFAGRDGAVLPRDSAHKAMVAALANLATVRGA